MPLYRGEMRFASDVPGQPARRWRNTYYLLTSTAAEAADNLREGWTEHLRDAARERVYCYEVYASSVLAGDDDFVIAQVVAGEQRGALPTPSGTDPYLPKACLAVTLLVQGSRPSRKFYRPGLYEADIVAGVGVVNTLTQLVRDQFNAFIVSLTPVLVDPDTQLVIGVQKITLTTREFGRESTADVPLPPPLG